MTTAERVDALDKLMGGLSDEQKRDMAQLITDVESAEAEVIPDARYVAWDTQPPLKPRPWLRPAVEEVVHNLRIKGAH